MKKNATLILILFFIISSMCVCAPKKKNTKYPGRLKPGSAEYLLHEGLFYLSTGKLDMAEKKMKKALKKKETLIGAINGLGVVYLNKREFKKSLSYFQKVIKINSTSWDAYNYIGVIYTELGEYNLAKENLLRAANGKGYRTPENAYVNLALLEIGQNRFDAALRYVEKGFAINERFPPLSNLMGIILEKQEKYPEALKWYKKALELLTNEDISYLINIGRIQIKMGQKEEALDILENALGKAPTQEMRKEIRRMIQKIE